MFKVRFSEKALNDFEAALTHIASESPHSAKLVRDRKINTVKHPESFSLGLPAPNGTWKLYVPKTPYFVIFRRDSNGDISIRAFVHSSREWEKIDWSKM